MSESRALVSAYIRSFIANGLVRLKYPDMTVVEDLADKYSASADGKTYTFELHPGVKWQDGQPFSSDDRKFTFEYFCHPDNPHPLTDDMANIVGAKEFKAKQATEISGLKTGPDHVEFSLIAPSNSFLVNVATAIMMPRHVLQEVAPADFPKHAFARQPIYTGPFKVDEWKSGESITYSAFADHFKGRAKLDKVVQRIFPDPTTAVTELRSGGIQQAFIASPDQYADFKSDSNYTTQELAGTLGWFFSWGARSLVWMTLARCATPGRWPRCSRASCARSAPSSACSMQSGSACQHHLRWVAWRFCSGSSSAR